MCHRYRIQLLAAPEPGAPPTAVGSIEAGSAFWSTGVGGLRWVTDVRVENIPAPYATDTDYPANASALHIPSNRKTVDCRPCTIGSVTPPPPRRSDDEEEDDTDAEVRVEAEGVEMEHKSSPTSPPANLAVYADFDKRQASSCKVNYYNTAAAAATNVAPAAAAAAAAAVAAATAANALGPAAAALTKATSSSAFAAAIAAAEAAVEAAQDAAATIWGIPDIPDLISQVADQVISASSSISDAMQNAQNVIPPSTPIPPDTDPAKNPNINLGPPPNTPAAACFGAGSKGFLKTGDSYFSNANGKAPATLVDVGSNAFFGLTLPDARTLEVIIGCSAVYVWAVGDALAPNFQVNCATNELGSYWSGKKQACYSYSTGPGTFVVFCGNNLGSIYSCLQGAGLYGTLSPAFISWATS
ncbi:hypothetical protein L227DRAFT_611879 [Lentinus tigrinus ALCF2SS1-6]|uniref:Uncharacterized protein n=1 Tax=Lentinus tigrinus ALCF2SS1-6 TaxID=1328759 RepID=A0A5C2S8X2_9APHY|nr:hypothetical protein L227DRAFT_611879 [Lentinus tigrinus ALCF2SS1-6]